MRTVNLLKIAAEAELLRLKAMLKRHSLRAAYGLIAAIFALSVLALANVAGWQVIHWYVKGLSATLILLGFNLLMAVIFAMFTLRSSPGRNEREALSIRRQALLSARGSLPLATVIPVASGLLRYRRSRRRR